MVAKYLRRVVKDGQDLEAREGMAWADTCGGLASPTPALPCLTAWE